jgi:hypothetical protein
MTFRTPKPQCLITWIRRLIHFVLRGYVRHWLDNVWAEDRAGLVDIVEAKESPSPTVAKPRAGP